MQLGDGLGEYVRTNGGCVRRNERPRTGDSARPIRSCRAGFERRRPTCLDYRRREAELLFRRIGITFAVYGEADATGAADPVRRDPAHPVGKRMDARCKRGLEAARQARSTPISCGHLPQARHPARRHRAGGPGLPEPGVPAGDERPERAARHLRAHRRHRHRARRCRHFLRAGGQCAHALRRLLHAGEPRDHDAAVPGPVRAPPRRAGRELSRRTAGDAAIGRAADAAAEPTVVLLTPGVFNSAYYEHSFLADKLGIELVEGRDLFVKDDIVYMRTTQGPEARRRDLSPHRRRLPRSAGLPRRIPRSACPGLMAAYQAGNVTLANAVGTGVADDKAIYSYMPEIVKFYLGEEPILKNVPTWRCREPKHLAYVLDHLDELVVKEVHGSGGYGMLIGPDGRQGADRGLPRQAEARPDRTSSRSRRWRSRPARPASTPASRRATSICGPFVLTGRDRHHASCRAG